MNREILFRGKRMTDGRWVYGDYHQFTCTTSSITPTKTHYIMGTNASSKAQILVDPATVGQWTGLTDRAGKRIFEGDILSRDCYDASGRIVKVVWAAELAQFSAQTPSGYGLSMLPPNGKVIGNVYDHPELLKGETKNGEN